MRVADTLVVVGIVLGDLDLLLRVAQVLHDGPRFLEISLEVSSLANLVVSLSSLLLHGLGIVDLLLLRLLEDVEEVSRVGALFPEDILDTLKDLLLALLDIDRNI